MFSGVYWNQPVVRVSVCVQNTSNFVWQTPHSFASIVLKLCTYIDLTSKFWKKLIGSVKPFHWT